MERQQTGYRKFDFDWKFIQGDVEKAEEPDYCDESWRTVQTPHDWSVEGGFCRENPTGGDGAYLPAGIGWYRKRFEIPGEIAGKEIFLQFDGVYQHCSIWLNGRRIGGHCYGYTGFRIRLTPYLSCVGANLLAVRVDNSRQPGSRWYSGSGIFRHVWMVAKEKVRFAFDGISVQTEENGAEQAILAVNAGLVHESGEPLEVTVENEIFNGEVSCARSVSRFVLDGDTVCRQRLRVEQPHLWSDADPFLYRVTATVAVDGKILDRVSFPYGIRTATFDKDRGFLLNGQRTKLNGVCLHHDGGCVGAAVPEKIWVRRLRLLKRMGCNAVRTSHNPPSPEFLDLLDQMGFLVMEEAFDEWTICKVKNIGQEDESREFGYSNDFQQNAEQDLRAMLRRDRNHPCVVLWSVGNEIPEQPLPEGAGILKRLIAICREEDASRPVTAACDKISAEPDRTTDEFMDALDVVGYNYVDRWRTRAETFYAEDRHRYPHHIVIGSENRSIYSVRGEYSTGGWPDDWFAGPYTATMIPAERLWRFTAMHDYVAGDFMWTGIDYLGEARWPDKNASFGVIDTCGFPKDAYYFYRSVWTKEPMVHLFPHWNWAGREGGIIPVRCYTNCESAELFLNGRSYGEKFLTFPTQGMTREYGHFDRPVVNPTTSDLHLSWDVPYEPGCLRVVGRNAGAQVCTQEIVTAGEPYAVEAEADSTRIRSDGQDIFHLTIRITDRDGRIVPNADPEVSVQVDGPGELIGMDNGKPDSHEPFCSGRRKAFHGLCLAVIRSRRESGTIGVTVAAEGLLSRCTVQVEAAGAEI